jgi:hypothetical protein
LSECVPRALNCRPASYRVLHGSRFEDFARGGSCGDMRGNVDGDTLHILVSNLDLAGM